MPDKTLSQKLRMDVASRCVREEYANYTTMRRLEKDEIAIAETYTNPKVASLALPILREMVQLLQNS